jgi:hypothetical protein
VLTLTLGTKVKHNLYTKCEDRELPKTPSFSEVSITIVHRPLRLSLSPAVIFDRMQAHPQSFQSHI